MYLIFCSERMDNFLKNRKLEREEEQENRIFSFNYFVSSTKIRIHHFLFQQAMPRFKGLVYS